MRKRKRYRGTDTLLRLIARYRMLGWSAPKIARQFHRTPRAIRYQINTPEFEAIFAKYEAEVLDVEDRKVRRLWPTTVRRLLRLLKHPDPRIALDAIDQVRTMLGPVLERHLAQMLERQAGSRGQPQPSGERTDVALTNQQREAARTLMRSIRSAQPQPGLPSQIVARIEGLSGPNQN